MVTAIGNDFAIVRSGRPGGALLQEQSLHLHKPINSFWVYNRKTRLFQFPVNDSGHPAVSISDPHSDDPSDHRKVPFIIRFAVKAASALGALLPKT